MLLPPSATLPRLPTAVWRSLHRTLPRPHTRSAAGASSSPAPIPSTLPHYADYPLDRAAALRYTTSPHVSTRISHDFSTLKVPCLRLGYISVHAQE